MNQKIALWNILLFFPYKYFSSVECNKSLCEIKFHSAVCYQNSLPRRSPSVSFVSLSLPFIRKRPRVFCATTSLSFSFYTSLTPHAPSRWRLIYGPRFQRTTGRISSGLFYQLVSARVGEWHIPLHTPKINFAGVLLPPVFFLYYVKRDKVCLHDSPILVM